MTAPSWITAALIVLIVAGVLRFFRTPLGDRIGRYAPEPFWIYFFSILIGLFGIAPAQSPIYTFTSSFLLPAAVFLMLVGSPVTELLKLGRKASLAMALASGTMFVAVLIGYAIMGRWLPAGAWKGAGALLGTWIGGSANMIAVKEILRMPDSDLAPLIIMDTILSYAWLALLLLGPALQAKFDRGGEEEHAPLVTAAGSVSFPVWMPAVVAAVAAMVCARFAGGLAAAFPVIPSTGWTLVLASLLSILAALTPLRGLGAAGASKQGGIALYVVLAAIGARTELQSVGAAPLYIGYGALVLALHGALLLGACRALRIPLYLASTASQANVGGAVSAPIVAEAYRPGTASVGVLMAVAGAILGTWAGVAGGWICRWIGSALWMK